MPEFGTKSNTLLEQLNPKLNRVLSVAIKFIDFAIIEAGRGEKEQNYYYNSGSSKAKFGESPHNWEADVPGSLAVDILPWPVPPWNSYSKVDIAITKKRFDDVLYVIDIVAAAQEVELDFGRDFNTIIDMPHIQLANWKEIKQRLIST